MYEEHTLRSGEIMVLTNEHPYPHPTKPWNVSQYDTNDECRWAKDFATETEARAEYVRFDR